MAHEILDPTIMMIPFRGALLPRKIGCEVDREDCNMKWETPEAVDFRFGMEITMYVANR